MNRILLLLVLMIAATVPAAAAAGDIDSTQEVRWIRFGHTRYGISAGAGMNSIAASNASQKLQLNVSAGMYASWADASWIAETGLYWHRREFDLTGMIPQYTALTRVKTSLNYLEVPFKVGYQVLMWDIKSREVYVTPHIGLYAGCAVDGHTDGFRRFDFGGKFGLTVDVDRWRIGFDYTHGWVDINRRIDRHVRTRSFDFTIGYAFFAK